MLLIDETSVPKRKGSLAKVPPPKAAKAPPKPPPKPAGKAPSAAQGRRKAPPPPPSPPPAPKAQAKAPAKNGSTFTARDLDPAERAEILTREANLPLEQPVARGMPGPVPPVPTLKPRPPPAGTVPVAFKGGRMEITYKGRVRVSHNTREGTVVIEEFTPYYPELEDPK
jgi:hypothetical protein